LKFGSIIALVFFLALSCIKKNDSALDAPLQPDPEKTIRVQLAAEPLSLDPALAEDGMALRIICNVMEGLVGYDNSGRLANRLAASVHVSGGGRRYEFTLRPGARWSDGRAVAAGDFVAGLRRSLAPATGAKLAHLLYPLKGARAYNAGKSGPETLGVRALPARGRTPQKLVMELEHPVSWWLEALTLPLAMPVREDILAGRGGKWTAAHPVTGPYGYAAPPDSSRIMLVPNAGYYSFTGSRIFRPVPVLLQIIHDESTAARLFEAGRLDILTKVPPVDIRNMTARGQIKKMPFAATFFIGFNTRKPPFDDREVRRAFSNSINRVELAEALGGGEVPARSWIPHGIEGFVAYEEAAYLFRGFDSRAAAAKKRLGHFGPVSAAFDSGARNSMAMEKIQQDIFRNLGVRVSLTSMDWKSYVKNLAVDAPPVFRFAWMAPFNDPVTHLAAFTRDDPNNYSGWSDPEYDALVSKISLMRPGPARALLIRKAQEILVGRDAVIAPVYHYSQVYAVSGRVRGFSANRFGLVRYDELGLK